MLPLNCGVTSSAGSIPWQSASEAPMRSVSRVLPRQPRKGGPFAGMPYETVPAFMAHLHARLSAPRLALEFLILTAARSGEVRGAKWNELDLKAKLWTLPASRMKVGKEHDVPLSTAAIDVLERARQYHAPCSNLLFPGRIVEPVQGEGGARTLDCAFLQRLRQLCSEHGVLLIFDEVQCGMGRTGQMFAHQWFEHCEPDIMAVAKALAA